MAKTIDEFETGQRVRVTRQLPQRNEVWATGVTGTVECYEQRTAGSWLAHAKNNRLWLDRLVLRKDDGEIVICILDNYTRVEILQPPPGYGRGVGRTITPRRDRAGRRAGRDRPPIVERAA